jgi:hypothetical protein
MAGADEGGLRVGPYVPESGLEPTDGSTESAVTEIIPAVTDGSSDPEEVPKVRAVARRSAVALPALGRSDSTPTVPRSSRSTLDRRERARERERAAAAAASTSPTTGADGPTPAAADSAPVASVASAASEDERPPRPRPVNPFAARPPQPRQSPEQTPAPGPAPAERAPVDDDTAEVEMVPGPPSTWAERGPVPIPDDQDTWDEEPSGALGNDAYQGRRRARRRARRPLVVAGIVVLLVGALVVVPLMLRSTPTGGAPAAVDPSTQQAVVVPPLPTPTGDDGEISSTAGPGASATATRTPAKTTTRPVPVAPVDPPVTTAATPTTAAPPFQTLTVEGEASNVVAPAERSSYSGSSGGQIVGFLGITQGRSGQGRLILSGVSVPTTGTYTVTFHYIANNNRTAHIIVNGNQAGTVAVSARTDCCGTGSLNVTLQAGTNTIEITNPTGRCPAIDRVVITRP